MENNKKVAIKSKGIKHGLKVVKYLESLGGGNTFTYEGACIGLYYFIDVDNNIDISGLAPKGYTEIELPEEDKEELTFPREMLVWDDDEEEEGKELVYGIFPDRCSDFKVIGTHEAWKNAKEIPAKEPETIIDHEAKLLELCQEFVKDVLKLKS